MQLEIDFEGTGQQSARRIWHYICLYIPSYNVAECGAKMRNLLLGAVTSIAVLVSSQAYAGDAKLKAGLVEARATLVIMTKDPTKRDASQQAMVKKSADTFSEMLAATTPPAGKEAAFKDLTETWAAFKATREKDLVPAILAGNQAEVDKAGGIQKDRYEKC